MEWIALALLAIVCWDWIMLHRLRTDCKRWRGKAEWLALSLYNVGGAAYPEETDKLGYTPEYFLNIADEDRGPVIIEVSDD